MANNYIYFLIILTSYSRRSEAYFLSDDLGTNLPERFGDPIDENWQDKRSVANDYSSYSKEYDTDKDSTDFDYKNGNAETDEEDKFEKRESKLKRNYDEPRFQRFNEANIEDILAKLSTSDNEALDSLINEETPIIDLDKRELLRKFENNFNLNKRSDVKMNCKGTSCKGYREMQLKDESNLGEDYYNHSPEKFTAKRKLKYKRSNKYHPTSHESILQAKISILKDNYKRNSEIQNIENSANKRSSNDQTRGKYGHERSINSKLMSYP